MYKLVISPKRTSALMHASHVLDNRTVVMVIADGMEEFTQYEICFEAKKVQRRFEVEKGYKKFSIRQLYMMNQKWYDIDYELLAVKLQLLCAITPFTHIYYMRNGDQRLYTICQKIIAEGKKLEYSDKFKKGWGYDLKEEELTRKLDAIERFYTNRRELLYSPNLNKEFIQRM